MSKVAEELQDPDQKRLLTKRIFFHVAPKYDFVTKALSFFQDSSWKKELFSFVPSTINGPILDCACGTGDLLLNSFYHFKNNMILGIDLQPMMLQLAQKRVPSAVHVSLQDLHSIAVKDKTIGLITGGYALRNAPDINIFVEQAQRILYSGGIGLFLDFTRSPNKLIAFCHWVLLKFWGSMWGLLLHRDMNIYGYISDSLRKFPDRKQLHRIFQAHGFEIVRSELRMFGMIELLMVKRV